MIYNFHKRNTKAIDNTVVKNIANELALEEKFIELLFCRGLESKKEIESFLSPNESQLFDPFLLKGMSGAVDRIKEAIENNEKILVFGDYDADGVCSSAILYKYFTGKDVDCVVHIPNRHNEGYGLKEKVLERLIEEHNPDLIISCDCGITAVKEVEFVLDLGLDIIITDHHECSENLPECICINPKQSDCNYPIDYLCGAGVVFKLVEALEGREVALEYAFITAVATIADMVPLISENRAIVALGLKAKRANSLGLASLVKNLEISALTANEIAFKVAPRINACGRMGDARRAFELIVSDDKERIAVLIEEINKDNEARKIVSEKIIIEALEDLKEENLAESRAIVLSHPTWDKGITGIVSAQLSNQFNRPCFIMAGVDDDSIYKGTCRGIEGVSVYEVLTKCSDLLVEFGGHAQASGFSIKKENIGEFKRRVQDVLSEVDIKLFLPSIGYDLELLESDCTLSLAKNLLLLEPTGVSNIRPNFLVLASVANVNCLGSNYRHIQIKTANGLSIMAFNGLGQLQFLTTEEPKNLICELSVNVYHSRESVRLILKASQRNNLYISDELAKANFIKNISIKNSEFKPEFEFFDSIDLADLVGDNIYGTLIVVGTKISYENAKKILYGKNLLIENMTASIKNNYSRIMLSPHFDKSLELAYFNKIVFVDTPPNHLALISQLNKRTKATIFIPKVDNSKDFFVDLDISRENLLRCYSILNKSEGLVAPTAIMLYQTLKSVNPTLDPRVFMLALSVFYELGLIKIVTEPFSFSLVKGVKRELDDSEVYKKLKEII
ncbi:MAG: single-stranded-DNA-specific exonuclease RecJ [Firmicutes bacterium]|nr:single-stranded-DNA-specific exonuclease RecJ [Bacillota bacterium]